MTAASPSHEELIEGCQGLVHSLALKIHRQLNGAFELDDLIGYGQLGLAQAARNFTPDAGPRFATFAYYRIRGSIYDGLGKLGWISRWQRRRIRNEALSNDLLELDQRDGSCHVPGDVDEVASASADGLRGPKSALQKSTDSPRDDCLPGDIPWFRHLASQMAVVYLATDLGERADAAAEVQLEDQRTAAPPTVAIQQETVRILHNAIAALPGDAGTLIRGLYFEGLSLQEMAQRLDINKGWASRLHAKTLARLAHALSLAGIEAE